MTDVMPINEDFIGKLLGQYLKITVIHLLDCLVLINIFSFMSKWPSIYDLNFAKYETGKMQFYFFLNTVDYSE